MDLGGPRQVNVDDKSKWDSAWHQGQIYEVGSLRFMLKLYVKTGAVFLVKRVRLSAANYKKFLGGAPVGGWPESRLLRSPEIWACQQDAEKRTGGNHPLKAEKLNCYVPYTTANI